MPTCFSLNSAYYFFGHNSSTSIGQEEETGIITGLADYLRVNAPYALHLPSGRYEDFYGAPWATTREFEEKHRELFNEIGSSIRGSLYCLLKRMFSKRNVVYQILVTLVTFSSSLSVSTMFQSKHSLLGTFPREMLTSLIWFSLTNTFMIRN